MIWKTDWTNLISQSMNKDINYHGNEETRHSRQYTLVMNDRHHSLSNWFVLYQWIHELFLFLFPTPSQFQTIRCCLAWNSKEFHSRGGKDLQILTTKTNSWISNNEYSTSLLSLTHYNNSHRRESLFLSKKSLIAILSTTF